VVDAVKEEMKGDANAVVWDIAAGIVSLKFGRA